MEAAKKFKKVILDCIRSKENSFYAIHYISGLKLQTRLRLNISHLNEQKFQHNFKDSINCMCSCDVEPRISA